MAKNKYYYYDQESCSFVEVEPGRDGLYTQGTAVLVLALVLAGLIAWGMDVQWIGTPEEAALKAENEALRKQVADVGERMKSFSERLDELSTTDQELYRTLLRAEPISEDVRQVGVGGADLYEEVERFSGPTASLLRETSQRIDEVERRMNFQTASFRRLSGMAAQHREELRQLPALLPADGRVISGYGLRHHPILQVKKMHAGIDVLLDKNSPVVAPGDGVVKRISRSPGYGRFLEIEHSEAGYVTRYAHLNEVMPHLKVGREVKRGEKIALSGNSGRSTGPHLHYEVHDAEGRSLNPVHFFAPSMTPEQYRELLSEAENSGAALDY